MFRYLGIEVFGHLYFRRVLLFLHRLLSNCFATHGTLGYLAVFMQYLHFSAPFVLHPREMLFVGVVIVFPTHGTLGYPDPLTSQANTLFVASPSILTRSVVYFYAERS